MTDDGLARAVDRLAQAVEAGQPAGITPMPRRLRASGPGLQAMAAQFRTAVPAAYLTERGVRCTCGAETVLERPFVACSGDCGRWFLPTSVGGARVAGPYPKADETPDAA